MSFVVTDAMEKRFFSAYDALEKEEIIKLLFDAHLDISELVAALLHIIRDGNFNAYSTEKFTQLQDLIEKCVHNKKILHTILIKENFEFTLREYAPNDHPC